jgi:hypothetical protein
MSISLSIGLPNSMKDAIIFRLLFFSFLNNTKIKKHLVGFNDVRRSPLHGKYFR